MNNYKWIWISAVVFISAKSIFAQQDINSLKIPTIHQQIILVTTTTWKSTEGTLQLYSNSNDGWILNSESIDVAVGKNGIAWGRGLYKLSINGAEKMEGDGKAPAGIFELGVMFGYDDNPYKNSIYPYKKLTDRDYFIDDASSSDYNRWVTIPNRELNEPSKLWRSFERMRRIDHLYEFGVVVEHNTAPVIKGKGSAIFLHVWRRSASPTLGCTAMSKENMLKVMKWLDPNKNPILIQIPVSEISNLNSIYFGN